MALMHHPLERDVVKPVARPSPAVGVWPAFCVLALLSLEWFTLPVWAALVLAAAAGLAAVPALRPRSSHRVDTTDLAVVAALYVAVVALFRAAFTVFTTDNVLGLFLCFAGGLLVGTVGPVVYQTWTRGRPLRSLGLGLHQWRPTVAMALLLAAAQFLVTFWGFTLPAPDEWVPLLGMSLVVGFFEAVFFRGFVQGRLEASFGPAWGVAGAAALYAVYHVGYGMAVTEMWFLLALGVVYAVAYRLTTNVLVIWPLLTPMGSMFNNIGNSDIVLPWASLLGFADVAVVMAAAIWLSHRHQKSRRRELDRDAASRSTQRGPPRTLRAGGGRRDRRGGRLPVVEVPTARRGRIAATPGTRCQLMPRHVATRGCQTRRRRPLMPRCQQERR